MSNESSTREKVREMAKLSVLTDKINEVQIINLKRYPFVFFEGVQTAEISYDLHNNMGVSDKLTQDKDKNNQLDYTFEKPETRHLRVSYHLTLDERLNGQIEKRFAAIEQAVRTLFWKQVKVEVFFNGTLKFESKKDE